MLPEPEVQTVAGVEEPDRVAWERRMGPSNERARFPGTAQAGIREDGQAAPMPDGDPPAAMLWGTEE